MLILAHRVPDPTTVVGWRVYETVYAHMEKMLVSKGATVKRGQQIGSVGTANGKYFAHLHFEVRESTSVYPGPGYSDAPLDRVSPEAFVAAHHGGMNDEILPAP
jgi:murein DD-endopeptidase MepM/ murein hydrolase activator NlpD